ncbi:MAG: YgeY family selenium metabolism-linked hydrolase [Halanaerobium sp.]|nr:YgeY family selenium metabolism-linked hydrolase [Halanaerobium sp.]
MHQDNLKEQLNRKIDGYQKEMIEFMRQLIAIPGESCQEEDVVIRIKEEMEEAGFDSCKIDPMGNLLGRVGNGSRVIAFDAHVDTVGTGNPAEWQWDPYQGKFANGIIYGRGATDQRAAVASMVYAGRAIKELGLYDDFSIYFVGSVQEEDCDGLCWQYILEEDGLYPELVVITEPTNLNIYRGHRGRMEMEVITKGVSCHGSAPERGENSLYKMAPIISGIAELNKNLGEDPFLGRGTIAVTHIENQTPSLCAIPNRTAIHLDRRLTAGEDKELAASQVEEVICRAGVEAEVVLLNYAKPSYTGLTYPADKYYPTWSISEGHPVVEAARATYRSLFSTEPKVDKWTFSTNGVSIAGRYGIPCIGFGPADEEYAHTVKEQVPVEHLLKAAAFYALFPAFARNIPS